MAARSTPTLCGPRRLLSRITSFPCPPSIHICAQLSPAPESGREPTALALLGLGRPAAAVHNTAILCHCRGAELPPPHCERSPDHGNMNRIALPRPFQDVPTIGPRRWSDNWICPCHVPRRDDVRRWRSGGCALGGGFLAHHRISAAAAALPPMLCRISWLVSWLVGQSVSWSASWLVKRSVGQSLGRHCCTFCCAAAALSAALLLPLTQLPSRSVQSSSRSLHSLSSSPPPPWSHTCSTLSVQSFLIGKHNFPLYLKVNLLE
jgi:hypothetical protein